jgi:hypothetical protein
MADYVTAFHFRYDTVEEMKIRPANSAGGHLDNGIARCFDLRIRNGIASDVAFAMPA